MPSSSVPTVIAPPPTATERADRVGQNCDRSDHVAPSSVERNSPPTWPPNACPPASSTPVPSKATSHSAEFWANDGSPTRRSYHVAPPSGEKKTPPAPSDPP